MADIAQLGIAVDTSQTKIAARELDNLASAGGRAEASTKKLESTARKSMADIAAATQRGQQAMERMAAAQERQEKLMEQMARQMNEFTRATNAGAGATNAMAQASNNAAQALGKQSAAARNAQASMQQATEATQGMGQQFDDARSQIGLFSTAAAVAIGVVLKSVADTASEIERFAMLAGSTPQEFQRMAAGAKSAGMDMEKYASVMKDTQDKIGDFLQTGGGELKDFFEKIAPAVGVTAEQFKNLSGPQALQLFYNSLQKANLSQKETVFWMESIADDATTLVPLLQNNGAAFDALADRAAKYGAVLSDYALAASKDFKGQTDELTLALQGAEQILAVGLMPTLTETARELLATADSAGIADTAATVIRTTLEALVIVASDVAFTFTAVGREIGGLAAQAQAFLSLDFARAGQIRAMMKEDAAGARSELEAFQARLLNAGQTAKDVFNLSGVMKANKAGTAEYNAALGALIRMKDDGTVSASQFTAAIKGATAANVSAAAAAGRTGKSLSGMGVGADDAKKAAEKAKAAAEKIASAYATTWGNAAKLLRDVTAEEQNLNAAEKALADVMAGDHWVKFTAAQQAAAKAIYDRASAAIEARKIEEADAKWASESADANANVAESAYEAANAAEAQRDAQLQANAAIGLTALEVANLEAARIDDTAAEKQRLAAIMEGIDPAIAADYRRQAQALTELAEAKRDGAVKDAMVESAKEAADEWKRTADKIEDSLIDALMNGGKSGAEYIEDLFRTMVLRPVLQVIVSPVAGAATAALGFSGAAQAGTGSAIGGLAGNAISSSLGTGAFMGAAGAGASMALSGGMGVALEGGIAMLGSATGVSSAMAGIGQIAGALGPVALGAAALDAITGGKVLSGISKILGFGGDDKPKYRYQTGGGDFEDKVSVAGVYGDIGMHDNGSKNIKAADFTETFQAIADLDAAIAATLSPDQNAQIKTALDNYVSGKNESTADYVADRMKIMADVIGGGVNELVDQFGGTSEELVNYMLRLTQAQPTIDALAFLGKSLGDTEAATLSAALAMENLVGGQQNLLALTSSYYQNFYTEAERSAHATQALTDSLAAIGVDTMPATREAFRDLVEAQDLTTESGRATYAGLLGVSGAFAALVPATEVAANSIEAIDQAYQRLTNITLTAEQAAQQRIDLEGQLLQLQGDTASIRERELASIDPSNQALQQRIWALEDEAQAASQRIDLEGQLLQLQGDTAAIRERELASIDPSNQALQQRIWALEDEAAAQADAAASYQSMIDMIGLSADSLSSAFKQIVAEASSAEEARKLGEEAASGMIAEAIANTMIGTVSNLVSTAILQPMTTQLVSAASTAAGMDVAASATSATALTAGATTAGTTLAAGGAAAASALDSVVAQAVSAAESMAEVLQDVSFQNAMADVVDAIGEISESLYTNINSTQEVVTSLESVSTSITEAARQFRDVTEFDLSRALIDAMDIDHYINRASESAQSALEKYPVAEVDWGVFDQYKQWYDKLLEANQEMQDLELGRIPDAADSMYAQIQSRIRQALKMLEELGPQIGGSAFSLIDAISASASDLGDAFSELAQASYVGENETPFDALNQYIAGFSEDSQTAAGMISQTAGYFSDLSDGIASVMEAVDAVGAGRLEFEPGDWAGQYFAENSEMFAIIGEAAGRFSDTIIETIAGDTIAALESNPILDSLTGENLQSLGIVISQVTEGSIPQLVAAFDTLNVALASGAITAEQYDALVETTLGQFKGANDAAEAIETVAEAYERLTNVVRTNADIAQEQIDLEERLFNATATTSEAAQAARDAIDPLNLALYDQVIAAETAKAAADERVGLENQLLKLMGDTAELRRRELEALDPSNQELQQRIWAFEDEVAAAEKAKAIADERLGLENQLLQLQGDTAELRRRELEALDPSNQELQQRIWAFEDEVAAAEKAKAIADERLGLENQLLQLQGDTAELRRRELEAIDPANRALQEHIWALEDEATAAEAAKAIADERLGLENQLLQLQGDTAELRRRELEAIDPANRALQEHIWALEDEATAAEAAKAIADERLGLENQLLQLQGDTAELRRRELEAIDPANRALQEHIWALEDSKVATESALSAVRSAVDQEKTLLQQASDARLAISQKELETAQERVGIEQAALQLLGNTTELRRRELDALNETNRSLQQRVWAVEDASAGIDNALGLLQRSISAEKERIDAGAQTQIDAINAAQDARQNAIDEAQKAVGDLQGLFGSITDTVKTLRGNVLTEQQNLDQAQAYIAMSLSLARAGGDVNQERLQEAMRVVAGDQAQSYVSGAEYRYQQARQAAALDELGGIVGERVSTAEAQLDALNDANDLAQDQIKAITDARDAQIKVLDDQLKEAEDAVLVAKGIDVSVIGVLDAVTGLDDAIAAYEVARDALAREQLSTGHSAVDALERQIIQEQESTSALLAALDEQYAAAQKQVDAINGVNASVQSVQSAMSGLASAINAQARAASAAAAAAAAQARAASAAAAAAQAQAQVAMNSAPTPASTSFALPSFAVGTNYVPHDMVAQIHEGEAIVPREFNPAIFNPGNASNEELVQLVAALTGEVKRLQSLVQEGNREQRRTANAVNGQSEAPMLVESV